MTDSSDDLKSLSDKFNEAVFSNPNFELLSGARTQDGKLFELKPLFLPAAMIAEHLMDYLVQTLTVTRDSDGAFGRPKMPKVIFSPDPRPNAMALVRGPREIHLNLGLVVAFCSLPSTTSLLADLLVNPSTSFSEVSELAKSEKAIAEVAALMESWRQSSASEWRVLTFPAAKMADWWLYQEMLRFIIAHEFAHWLHSVYKGDSQRKLLDTAEQDIKGWMAQDQIADRRVMRNIQQLLLNPNVLERWKAEVCADAMGFQFCLRAFGGLQSPELRRTAYAGAALTFAMNGMLEVFFESIGQPVTGETHPSSYARYLIFTYILAKQCSLPHDEFLHREFGAGTAVSIVTGEVLSQYQARRTNVM